MHTLGFILNACSFTNIVLVLEPMLADYRPSLTKLEVNSSQNDRYWRRAQPNAGIPCHFTALLRGNDKTARFHSEAVTLREGLLLAASRRWRLHGFCIRTAVSSKGSARKLISMLKKLSRVAGASVLMIFASSVAAEGAAIRVDAPWIRLTPPGSPMAGYMVLENAGQEPATLVGAQSAAFGMVMLHRTMSNDRMSTMRHQKSVKVSAGGRVSFEPGAYHLMLMRPAKPLKVGDTVPITLTFEDGTGATANFVVRRDKP